MGCFVENHRPGFVFQALQMLPAALLCCGKKTLKAESAGGLPGNAQGRNDGTGPGDGAHGNARSSALFYQILTGYLLFSTGCLSPQRTGFAG